MFSLIKISARRAVTSTVIGMLVVVALATFSADPDAQAAATITATPAAVAPGSVITVVVAHGPGNVNDWVSLAAAGTPDTASVSWKFLGGGTQATLRFVAPETLGTYEVRLF